MCQDVKQNKTGVLLFSGGLDSTTLLAWMLARGWSCELLNVAYGQRHSFELQAAEKIAHHYGVAYRRFDMPLHTVAKSALTNTVSPIPGPAKNSEIPSTYVPARNLVFLSIALSHAESLGNSDIFIGVNAVDYSGYPDCREPFLRSFEKTANLATKAGVMQANFSIHAPFLRCKKSDIISQGISLSVPYEMTVSCYDLNNDGLACGACEACFLRCKGFSEAGVADPTRYRR